MARTKKAKGAAASTSRNSRTKKNGILNLITGTARRPGRPPGSKNKLKPGAKRGPKPGGKRRGRKPGSKNKANLVHGTSISTQLLDQLLVVNLSGRDVKKVILMNGKNSDMKIEQL